MAYQEPKTDWTESDSFQTSDANRIEANIEYLAGNGGEQQLGKTDDVEFGDIDCDSVTSSGAISGTTGTFSGAVSGTTGTFSGAISGTTVNTGLGATEVYPMDQGVSTSDSVYFTRVQADNVVSTYNGTVGGDLAVSGAITCGKSFSPYPTPVTGAIITASMPYTLSRGVWNVSGGGEIRVSGTWHSIGSGCLFSDGVNVRVNSSSTVFYQKY